MVEVPENDHRKDAGKDFVDFTTHAYGFETVAPRCPQHIARLAAVAGDAAGHAQFLERHTPPIVGEHDAERRRAAFHDLHLEDRRRTDPPRREQAEQGGHPPWRLSSLRSAGMTRLIGRTWSTIMSTVTTVPGVIL